MAWCWCTALGAGWARRHTRAKQKQDLRPKRRTPTARVLGVLRMRRLSDVKTKRGHDPCRG